jgi:hypothetical protein
MIARTLLRTKLFCQLAGHLWLPIAVSAFCFALAVGSSEAAKPPNPPDYVAKIDTSTALGNFTPRNNADTLVVLIHGWNSDRSIYAQGKIDITSRSVFRTDVWDYDWNKDSAVANPFSLVAPSSAHGQYIAYQTLKGGNYKHVQLVSHSAGAFANEIAARLIKKALPDATIQQTFLDAFLPGGVENLMGVADTCIDNYYFREQVDIPLFGRTDFLKYTQQDIPKGANYDLTDVNPNPRGVLDIAADHGYPYRWYQGTVKGNLNQAAPKSNYDQYGYGFTKQVADGADNLDGFPKAWPSPAFAADKGKSRILKYNAQDKSIFSGAVKDVPKPKPQKDFVNSLSVADVIEAGGGGTVAAAEPTPGDLQLSLDDPSPSLSDFAYAEVQFDTRPLGPDAINFLQFDYLFKGGPSDGMLHVYLNSADNSNWMETGEYDAEFAVTPNAFESTTPIWLGDLTPGQYTLAFRFDSLSGDAGVQLRNFDFGNLSSVPEPATWLIASIAFIFLGWSKRARKLGLANARHTGDNA